MTIAALALAASLGYVPGDRIVAITTTLAPRTCKVTFIDEGVRIDYTGVGPDAMSVVAEARALVRDTQNPPDPTSALQQCLRAAKEACPNGIKSLEVTPTTCRFECYPPPVTPTNPTAPPPSSNPTGPVR